MNAPALLQPRLAPIALGALALWSNVAVGQVTIYGALDVGVSRVEQNGTHRILVGRGDNNKLGFKAVEDLGGGVSALMQIEARLEPDTGSTESAPNRPFWQGETRVGLRGGMGTLRVGRGLSAVQDTLTGFEPWLQASNRANLTAFELAGYNGDPLSPGSSQNRWANAVFYNSPVWSGAQLNLTVASKEALSGGTPSTRPTSVSGTYAAGPVRVMLGWEKNAVRTEFRSAGATLDWASTKLFATVSQQKPVVATGKTQAWMVGVRHGIGAGTLIAGYGHLKPDGTPVSSQTSLGYQYALSQRTFVYADGQSRRATGLSSFRLFDMGVHHNF